MNDDRQLLDEHVLRRALRLDADEAPPRLDPVLIAAAARMPAQGRNELVIAVLVAFLSGWVWSEGFRAVIGLAASSGLDPLAGLIPLVAAAAVFLAPVAEAATHPVVPIAILTAAVLAVFFEQRGRTYAASS